MDIVDSYFSFGGEQKVIKHYSSVNNCEMKFSIYLPPLSKSKKVPIIWYLSGLTCSHANVTEKGEFRKKASELGVAIICPDTSPRGENIPDEKDNWQFGLGAGFYIDATQEPYKKNYNMFSYITKELPDIIFENFPLEKKFQGIMGHSMGGHGALIMALNKPNQYKSCTAFAPIVQPSSAEWSRPAFEKYLGKNKNDWRKYDSTHLIEDGARHPSILVDQGDKDPFLKDGLQPDILEKVCKENNQPLTLRMQKGYDHSYYFISTFMSEHIEWHYKNFYNNS